MASPNDGDLMMQFSFVFAITFHTCLTSRLPWNMSEKRENETLCDLGQDQDLGGELASLARSAGDFAENSVYFLIFCHMFTHS